MGEFSPKECIEIKPLIENFLQNLIKLNDESVTEILKIWHSIYGSNCTDLTNRFTSLENNLKTFWVGQIEILEEIQKNHYNIVEQMGKEAFDLEKAMDVDFGVSSIKANLPLVQMEEHLRKILESCRELKDTRTTEYSLLQSKEQELCTVLDIKPRLQDLQDSARSYNGSLDSSSNIRKSFLIVPTPNDIKICKKRVREVEKMKDQLEYDFIKYKYELLALINDCEALPVTKVERFACANEEIDVDFPMTKHNLKQLQSAVVEYTKKKDEMVSEADQLREEVTTLSKKNMKCQEELNYFLGENYGFNKTMILRLKNKLCELKEERKVNLEELIRSRREMLEDLWVRCCFSEEQKARFRPFQVNHYSEEVLSFYEIEVKQLEDYYNKYKRIFNLLEKYEMLWERLLHLEELASDVNRLFDNRGGQLLQEEKERKLIQRKVPAVKAELTALLNDYKAENGIDFLYFGLPLKDLLEQKEQDYESCKENRKQERKVTNSKNLILESRLGSLCASGIKRKLTPQVTPLSKLTTKQAPTRFTAVSTTPATKTSTPHIAFTTTTKLVKEEKLRSCQKRNNVRSCARGRRGVQPSTTSAVSTPAHSTPSYESVRERMVRFDHKGVYGSTAQHGTGRVLRPRNLNKTPDMSNYPRGPSYKTPVSTPSQVPFRYAMSSKIPNVAPPTRSGTGSVRSTPRSKMPLMF